MTPLIFIKVSFESSFSVESNTLGPFGFLSTGHMLEPAEVVLTTSTAYNSPSITLIAKRIPEMDSAYKTTPKTTLNLKFLRTLIFAQISVTSYSVTGRTLGQITPWWLDFLISL